MSSAVAVVTQSAGVKVDNPDKRYLRGVTDRSRVTAGAGVCHRELMADDQTGWEIYDETLPFAGTRYMRGTARMIVLGIGDGDLLVVSPGTSMTDSKWDELAAWGTPRFLLVPNLFHTVGVKSWKERFADARVVADASIHKRLRKKLPGITIEPLDVLTAALPDTVRVFGPPMAKQGETWLSIQLPTGRAWFVTDAIVNINKLSGGAMGLMFRVVGFRERLMTNPLFKRIFLRRKGAYKAWVAEQLERDVPTMFVPAHGVALHGDEVRRRLQEVTDSA